MLLVPQLVNDYVSSAVFFLKFGLAPLRHEVLVERIELLLVNFPHLFLDQLHLVVIPWTQRPTSLGHPEVAFQHFAPLLK